MTGLDYEWIDGWGQLPDEPAIRNGWAHTGAAVTRAGDVVVGHPGEPTLLFLRPEGRIRHRVPTTGFVELHGLLVVDEDGDERLWIADTGGKDRVVGGEPDWTPQPEGGSVAQVDLDGHTVRTLERPDIEAYADGIYQPTSVAVDEPRFGGSGEIWVTDGYGASLVQRFGAGGR